MPTSQQPFCQVSLPSGTLCRDPPAYEAVVSCDVDRTVRVRSVCMAHNRDVRNSFQGWECRTCDGDGSWDAVTFHRLRGYRPPPISVPRAARLADDPDEDG